MAAKTALYILGGFLIIPGLFQFYNAWQITALKNAWMGEIVKQLAEQKIQFGLLLTIGGCILIAIGYFIKPSGSNKQKQ